MITTINEWKLFNRQKYQILNNVKYYIDITEKYDTCVIKIYSNQDDLVGKVILEKIELNDLSTVGFKYTKENYAYLRQLIVYPKYYQRGFSTVLLETAITKVKEWNYKYLFLHSGPLLDNITPENLNKIYMKHGFKPLQKDKFGTDMILEL